MTYVEFVAIFQEESEVYRCSFEPRDEHHIYFDRDDGEMGLLRQDSRTTIYAGEILSPYEAVAARAYIARKKSALAPRMACPTCGRK